MCCMKASIVDVGKKKNLKDILLTRRYWQIHRSEISLSYRCNHDGHNYLNDRPSLGSPPGTNIPIYSYYDYWQSLLETCPLVQAFPQQQF